MKKSALFFLVFISILSFKSFGQRYVDEDSTPMERIYFGGNFGLAFSNSYTQIEVSPSIGYMFTEKFSAGVGVIYQYIKADFISSGGARYSLQTSIYGGKLFGRYNVSQEFFAYSEFEAVSFEVFRDASGATVREIVPSFFIGGGYFVPIGSRAGFSLMALYNILYDQYTSPYNSPFVIRVGFSI